jgi:hypothetical protein
MRPIRVTVGAVANSAPIPLDTYRGPFNVGIGVVLSAGASLTYTVEHTFDDVFAAGFDPDTATWFANTGLTNRTATLDGNYAFPITAVRLRVSAHTGGTATMTVIQAGVPGGA